MPSHLDLVLDLTRSPVPRCRSGMRNNANSSSSSLVHLPLNISAPKRVWPSKIGQGVHLLFLTLTSQSNLRFHSSFIFSNNDLYCVREHFPASHKTTKESSPNTLIRNPRCFHRLISSVSVILNSSHL